MNRFSVSIPTGRFDLELCASSGQVFRWQRLDDGTWLGVDGDHWYRVLLPPTDTPVRTRDSLKYVAKEKGPGGEEIFEVESNASREDFESLFRLDLDAEEVEAEIVRRAPELEPYMGTLAGLRLMEPSDPVEIFFAFLCTPNNNIRRITQMVRKLAAYGLVMDTVQGNELHRFPEAEVIAAIPEQELRSAGFGYRGRTIPSLANQLIERGGRAWLESLKSAPYEDAHRELKAMKGIGPKLADCIALFALHHTEAVPVDTHIWQALCRLYFPEWKDKAPTDQRYETAAAHFRSKLGDLSAWAHQYLFYDNVLNWRTRN
ncbi:MAG: N-glycosylase/DNA lyase [Fimbriimonadaceae bacterium]|jgi:N-glycosylase/DNA lyase|nr:N-glycosylase/DNA lyase [Fimbriimonadaceae bacterium]